MKHLISPTQLYEEAAKRLAELEWHRSQILLRLSKAPDGKIHIVHTPNRTQYYLRTAPSDKSGIYLSKKESNKIKSYLQKSYDEKALRAVNSEIAALSHFLEKAKSFTGNLQQIYSTYPLSVRSQINPLDISDEEFAQCWMNIPYQAKGIPESVPPFITNNGEHVRSKSELTIANALFTKGIPYKYECPLLLSGKKVFHPDFTVLNLRKRKIIYWEHRGMMDDREYARDSVRKIKEYQKNGIFLGDRLIITEEVSATPLGTSEMDDIIRHYFL